MHIRTPWNRLAPIPFLCHKIKPLRFLRPSFLKQRGQVLSQQLGLLLQGSIVGIIRALAFLQDNFLDLSTFLVAQPFPRLVGK